MDSRQSLIPIGPIITFTIAIVSLGLTSVVTYHRSEQIKPQSKVRIFDTRNTSGLNALAPIRLIGDAKTNRTIWELVSSWEFQAGIQRVEPDAWIPSHSHETEEIIIVVSGEGLVYDENGKATHLTSGSMLHIEKNTQHAIRNINTVQPLLLVWAFPVRFGINKFQFQEKYT